MFRRLSRFAQTRSRSPPLPLFALSRASRLRRKTAAREEETRVTRLVSGARGVLIIASDGDDDDATESPPTRCWISMRV